MDLRAIDVAADKLARFGDGDCTPLMTELASLLGRSTNERIDARDVFSLEVSGEERTLILAVGLRLVAEASSCLDTNAGYRVALWAFLDTAAANLYQTARITDRQQTFEKEPRLRHELKALEVEFETLFARLSDATRVHDIRTRFMNWLSKNLPRAYVRPFLTDRLAVTRLGEVCDDIEGYLSAEGPAAVRAYDRACLSLSGFSREVDSLGTLDARKYLGRLASKLRELIDTHFDASALGKPAALVAEAAPKKYPLHEATRSIAVGLLVRNVGAGPAEDVRIFTTDSTGNVVAESDELYLGRMEERTLEVQIECRVVAPDDYALLSGRVQWRNYDGSVAESSFDLSLNAQRTDVDWDRLRLEDPYSLEPVESEDELCGRTEQLAQLTALATRRQLGSLILFGQKRVGKTSIAKTFAAQLSNTVGRDYHIIYVESGDYVDPDPSRTVANLGLRLCEELAASDPRLGRVPIPSFDGALKPLGDFLRDTQRVIPTLRVLFILDEFDELPIDLYRRGPIGDALFLTLRTQSGKPDVGFCLVGGEKMEHILAAQGDALNKFRPIRIDYFDKAAHWPDFADLVRKPVTPWLEVSDDALAEIYAQTAGNPFFTKLICGELYRTMVNRRDAHATATEVREAAETALQAAASNSFQHFWEDGIVDVGGRVEMVSLRRRRLLIALARLARQGRLRNRTNILEEAERLGVSPAEGAAELDEFVRRRVFDLNSGGYGCKVQFFEAWLLETGVSELITQALDPDAMQIHLLEDEKSYVRSGELVELVARWGLYRGARIGEDRVRAWLEQFQTPQERRLMFQLLAAIEFYGPDRIREKLVEAHGIVRRGLKYSLSAGRKKRTEILVSYLDGAGKSGSSYARMYASENQIYVSNVVERAAVKDALSNGDAQALVFVDDFIGTGSSASLMIAEIAGELKMARPIPTYVIAVCGFDTGVGVVENVIEKANLDIQVRVCDLLSDADRAFANGSSVYRDEATRLAARDVAFRYGRPLVKNAPLGYGDGQALVVFDQSIPNNCPPILWAHSLTWEPLFRRL